MKSQLIVLGSLMSTFCMAQYRLTSIEDSISYAIRVSMANDYLRQGVSGINPEVVARAVSDVQTSQVDYMLRERCDIALYGTMKPDVAANLSAGLNFRLDNAKRSNVVTTLSGLQYEILKEGKGQKANATDTLTVHYAGSYIDGKSFDSSYDRGEPIRFVLSQMNYGWREGLPLMSTGAKYRFVVPYTLAYGVVEKFGIPPGSTLLFEVELLAVGD